MAANEDATKDLQVPPLWRKNTGTATGVIQVCF